jgi:hypothetical protein
MVFQWPSAGRVKKAVLFVNFATSISLSSRTAPSLSKTGGFKPFELLFNAAGPCSSSINGKIAARKPDAAKADPKCA